MNKFYALFLLLFLFTSASFGQTFEIGGQVRPRAEFRNGYRSLIGDNVDHGFAISQRSRLNVLYTNKALKMAISLQDVRIWGDVPLSNKKDANGTAIQQAWAEYKFCDVFTAKMGRQPLSYDDERLLGGSNWTQWSRSHDVALFKFNASKRTTFHLGLSYNQAEEKDTGTFYNLNNSKAFQFLWFHHDFKNIGISVLAINNGRAFTINGKQDIIYSHTFGPYITYKKEKFKFNGAFYYQTGKNNVNVEMSALYASADLGYQVHKKMSVGSGFQYFTGNDQVNPDTKTDRNFNTLHGTAHKFNGWMDYFYAGIGHGNVGLLDIYAPIIFTHKKLTAEFQPHYFSAAASVREKGSAGGKMPSGLGVEADFMLSYNVTSEFNIQCGYSQMFGTETLQVLKGGNRDNIQNWVWCMLTFNPTFFKSEK